MQGCGASSENVKIILTVKDMFIVLEGVDGSGKSTQIANLQRMFTEQGVECEYLHFPRFDAPYFGDMIARFLRGELGSIEQVDPYVVALLYAEDRRDAAKMIRGWLAEGKVVICDRYVYSNVGYQCAKLSDDEEREKLRKWILSLEYDYFAIPQPDLSLFLDVPFAFTERKLKQEVREPAIYNAIITAIATGASRMSEISSKVGEDTNVCSIYLKNLLSLGIVQKETPYGEKASRKSIYSVEDNMFRFWYRFVPENNSIIARGADDLAYKRIEPHLSEYMGRVFEEICKQYLWKQLLTGKSPVEFSSLGRWWGNDPKTKSQTEIDIMGEADKNAALFGECKWTNEKVDVGVLDLLVERSKLFHYKNVHYYLFAKSGFTKGCIDKAVEMGNVTMVEFEKMI